MLGLLFQDLRVSWYKSQEFSKGISLELNTFDSPVYNTDLPEETWTAARTVLSLAKQSYQYVPWLTALNRKKYLEKMRSTFYQTSITDGIKAFKLYWMSQNLLWWWFKGGSVHCLLSWIKSNVLVFWWQLVNAVLLLLSCSWSSDFFDCWHQL